MDMHPQVDAQGSSDLNSTDLPDVDAAHVYVMMKKNTRVSRNIRACWFFRHLGRQVSFTPLTSVENLTEELNLVSVIPKNPEMKLLLGQTYQVSVGPDTIVTFLSYQYKLSFTLDLSPSMMTVDIQNASYVYDGILTSLSRCLRGLVMPLYIPGSCIHYSPDLYISVICHTPVVCSFTNQVLVQGVKINQSNVDHYLKHIEFELNQFEAALSSSFVSLLKLYKRKESFFLDEDEEEDRERQFNLTDHIGTPEAGFTNMLRYGILSLQLLPENSSSGIIIITDGIVGLPNSYLIELLLNQMRNNTTMCSFIKVGSPSSLYRKLAHVPHIELMQAIATATFGAYLGTGPDVSEEKGEANLYHRAILFWSFQRGLEGFKYDITHFSDEDMPGSISWIKRMLNRHPITKESYGAECLRKEREKRTVVAGLHSVLSVRLREGYTIKSVAFKKDNTEIHVKLHFPWRDYGKIEYAASAPWPLNYSSSITTIEVTVEGSYDLLHEMLCKGNKEVKSNLRLNNIKTLWTILERISSTDKMLEHLQSFSSEPVYYQTPESIRSGVPLFYIQPDGPSINTQLKASTPEKFAVFWKAVIQLDTNNWQKWLHSHRIGLVLEHDRQFPKCFQVPNASSRFSSIQCRQTLASLSLLLREWSTFVLAENHSYIKFLVQEQDKPPKFFCVLRLTSKAPNMIIRLGFLGGTPASIRLEELRVLREKIRDLCFPQRGTQKTQKMSISSAPGGLDKVVKPHKSPLNREGSEIACCVLLRKPVEKILVVYESKPSDMTVVKEAPKDLTTRKLQDPMRSVFRTLTHYLQHQRWVWNIQANTKSTLSMTAIGRMLATITKLRLQEGFHFAVSNAGVTNLVLEVDMKESEEASEDDSSNIHACVVQYIIFPPHTRSTDDSSDDYLFRSLSEDDRDDTETTEADGEVQIVTECWVEPQYGVCCNNTPERQHFNGLTYLDIAKTFFPYDYECVSSLTTFEHLMYMCDNSALPSPDLLASKQSSPPSTPGHRFSGKREESFRSEPTVNFIPFPFDLLSVLPRSQQAELLFSTFVIGEASSRSEESHEDIKKPNEILLELFFDKLKDAHNKEILLSDDECNRVISHIYQRTRDPKVNPIPFSYIPQGFSSSGNSFVYEPGVLSETDTTDASSTSVKRSSGSRFLKSPDPGVQAKERQGLDQQNQFYPKKFAEKEPNKSAATKGNAQSETGHCPMWKCYVKKDVTADHLLITFVPASYDDLLLLNQVTRAVTSQEDVSSDNLSHHPHEHSDVKDHSKVSVHPSSTSPDKSKINHPAISLTRTSEHSDQIEEVQLNLMSSNIKSHTNACGSLHLPIYVYSCQLKNVTNSLVNRWSFNLPDDIFEDLTFLQETLEEGKSPRSPRGQFLSFDQPADEMNDKDSWRSSLDRRSTDSNSFRLESFKEHCKLVTDIYLNSFVLAVFRSLQHNYFVDSVDVDAAINNICEELHPLETDMTSYLQATCSHLHQLVEKARSREKYSTESGQRSGSISSYHKQQAVRFLEFDLHKEEEAPKLPEVLQLPQQAIEITEEKWASLVPEQCIQIKENHKLTELIRSRFTEAIEKCLRPVPSLPDFYFYYPNNEQLESEDDMEDKEEFDVNEEDNADDTQDLVDIIIPMNEVISGGSSLESNIDDTSFDCNISNISIERDPMPLFVHFTCTIKQKSDFQHISLQSVPQCFGEITKGLPEPIHTIDFSDFKVTFDINCLTLLNEIDQPTPRKPSYRRLLSNISQTSASGKDDADEKLSALVGSPKPLGDPVSHLPKPQHAAVYSVKDEIEYLMQEEVISSLRCMHPITADTLAFVAKYISSAAQYNSRTVMYQTVNLQFVFGAEQSLNMFIEELERQSFPGCRLTKEGDFYFLIINKTRFQNMGPLDPNRSTANSEGVIISKEERSFSLPCVFPDLADQEGVPSGSRSLVNMGEEAGGSEASENKQRPRSCSDTKVNQRTKVSLNVGSTDVKAVISLPEANAVGPTLQDLRISELDVNAEQSLKKSSSFAGLQGGRSANLTANNSRSRHCSAPSGNNTMLSRPSTMPQSPSVISSRESTTDDGFDGDVSDMELDESASMSDISGYYPELPDYWLLMQVHQDKTEVFFHSREPVDSDSAASTANKVLYSSVIKGIQSVCKKVNQVRTLTSIHNTETTIKEYRDHYQRIQRPLSKNTDTTIKEYRHHYQRIQTPQSKNTDTTIKEYRDHYQRMVALQCPTALISFNIWECGNCDLTFFSDKLILALRHSLCDIVMEYFMLTTPICSVPRNLTESFAPPVSSLPASPTKLPAETTERKHNPLTRKFSVDPPRSSTLTFSLFSSFSELRNTNSEDKVGKCLDFNSSPQSAGYMSQPRTPGGLSTQPLRPKDASLSDAQIQQQTIAKYENGEKGHLHPVFCSLAKHWMDFCCSIGVPSVYSTRLKFQSKFNVEFVLKEFQQSVMSITSDTMLRIFKVIQTSSPLQPPYGVMFTPCKTTLKEAQMNRVLETMAAGGGQITLLAIGRSAEQWQSMVLEHQDLVPNISPSAVKGYKTSQRFVPQVPDSDNRGSEQTSLRLAERDFVPRQKLLLVVCEEKQLTLYLYNWHSDLISVVEKIISRIIQWNNARAHLLDSVLAQKMGLFHHLQFSDLHYTPTQNPYTQTSAEVDSLIRYHAPPRESRRNSSISNKEKDRIMPRSTKRMIPFDQTYKNMRPPKIMGRLMCTYMSDPISRHGLQAQDIRIQSRQGKGSIS
uniref:KICSTOR complex protein SZT2 n=1 Tax=Biomphalaria glabrata TaxID=6526 RepID=A0A2C9KFZ7_BIOGL